MQIEGTYKEIWKIALPIILGSLANSINQLIDTAYLGHYSKVALDAVTLSGIFYFNATFVAGGFARGCQIIIARYNGEMNYKKIGKAYDHLLVFSILLSLLIMLFFKYAGPAIIELSIDSIQIQKEAMLYIEYMNYGVPAVVFALCFNAFYSGIGKTRIITIATVSMTVANCILGYLLIYGKLGLPELGIKGAAIATTISNYILMAIYIVYFIRQQHAKWYSALQFNAIRIKQFKKIIDLSTPIVIQNLIGFSSWQYFFLCVEKIGEHELAVSGILKSIYIFLGIPVWSLATANNTIISNIIGQKKLENVVPALIKVLVLTVGISIGLTLMVLVFSDPVLSLFTNDAVILKDAIAPFYTLLFAMIFFSSAMIMNQGITGTGATSIPAIVELICAFIYIAYCYYFIQLHHSKLYIAWGCEAVYWFCLAFFNVIYWGSGTWRKYIQKVDAE